MLGDELGVEQAVAAGLQARDKVHQRDLRSVAGTVEHALTEEHPAQRDAVKAADQRVAVINFDAVAVAALMQGLIERPDPLIDPGSSPSHPWLGAAGNHGIEIMIDPHGEGRGPHGTGETRRDVEAGERNDPPPLGLDPVQRGVVGVLRHREDAAGVGLEKDLWGDRDLAGMTVCHRDLGIHYCLSVPAIGRMSD